MNWAWRVDGIGSLNIRLANVEDAGQIAASINALILELGGGALPVAEAQAMCDRVISGEADGAIVIADDGDRVVGVCTVSFQDAIRTMGKYAIIQEMYIDAAHRNGGLGAQLVDAVSAEAASHGCRIVELGTPPGGANAERFYERIGFSHVGRRLRRVLNSGE